MKKQTHLPFIMQVALFYGAFLISNCASAQHQTTYNLFSFTPQHKALAAEQAKATPSSFRNHPDYGVLPHNAPCSDCVERIDKRTSSQRFFEGEDSKGKLFYNQQSFSVFNYKDENGWLREVNTHLAPGVRQKVFSALHQPSPVVINLEEKLASITSSNKELHFNKNLQLVHIDERGKETSLGTADWTHFTAGDDGISIKNFYPGIDAEFIVRRGEVETNFILSGPLAFTTGYLVLKQDVEMPAGLSFDLSNTALNSEGQRSGDVTVRDDKQNLFFTLQNGVAYDEGAALAGRNEHVNLTSAFQNNSVQYFVPMNWLNARERIYPVVIDPTVQALDTIIASGTFPESQILGSGFTATCPPAVTGGGCTYSLTIWAPPNSIISDIQYSFNYIAIAPTWLNQGGFTIEYYNDSGCVASSPPGGQAGTCPLPINGICARQNQTIYADISSCVPPPQCDSLRLNFILHLYHCLGTQAGCSSGEVTAASDWVMTIIGRASPMINTSSLTNRNICPGECVTINATGDGGTPPYSFTWSPGGITSDSVTFCPTVTSAYTCTMTDACSDSAHTTYTDVDSFLVNVGPVNNPGFTISPSPCAGGSVTITGGGNAASADYDWQISCGGQTINDTNGFQYVFPNTGACTITLHYGADSCKSDSTITILVDTSVTSAVTIASAPPFPACPGDCINFTSTSTGGGTAPVYQWSLNGVNITGATSDTYSTCTLSAGDIIALSMISSAACATPPTPQASLSASFYTPLPLSVFVSDDSLSTQSTFTNYQWYLNGTAIPGATNYFYIASQSGTYYVTATDIHGCESVSGYAPVITAIDETHFAESIHVYPNPARDELYISANALNGNESAVEIYNSLGKKVFEKTISSKILNHTLKVHCGDLAAGIYLLKITSGTKNYSQKIILEK